MWTQVNYLRRKAQKCNSGITLQSSTHEEWCDFVKNPNTSCADLQINEIVTNCQNNISTTDVHNPDREKYNDGWCEVDERPSGVTDTLLQEPVTCYRQYAPKCTCRLLNINNKYVNV